MIKSFTPNDDPKDQGERVPVQLYIARFESEQGNIMFTNEDKTEVSWMGEILITVQTDASGYLELRQVRRLVISSSQVEILQGSLSLAGPTASHGLDSKGNKKVAPFTTKAFYPLLGQREPACVQHGAVFPQLDQLRGELAIEPVEDSGQLDITLRVQLVQEIVKGEDTPLLGLSFGPTELEFRPLPRGVPPRLSHNSLTPCHDSDAPDSGGTDNAHYALRVRFVDQLVLDPVLDAGFDVETTAQNLVNGACKVWWAKGGIKIVPDLSILEVAPGGNPPPADRIDIYLVNDHPDAPGGGITYNCGTNAAEVYLLKDAIQNNKYLLAHEIGHVFGLQGAGEGDECADYRVGSECSVMVPGTPNSSRNTLNNIRVFEEDEFDPVSGVVNVLGPPILTSISTGGLKADDEEGFFHYIRDFPYDDGTEPSVLESPFTNRWSDSDVWNSNQGPQPGENPDREYSDGSPMFNLEIEPHYAPVHIEPTEEGPNYMYVQLHGCQDILSSPVQVYLYLAVPGSSATNLYPLNDDDGPHLSFTDQIVGGTPVLELPSPGKPKIKNLTWDVPPELPSHCCVFAVAASTSDPPDSGLQAIIDNPRARNFYDLAALRTPNNDVAQRNLNIQSVSTSGSGSTSTMSAWVETSVDSEDVETSRIELDTTQAEGLEGLSLEVNGRGWGKIETGEIVPFSVGEILQQEPRVIVRLHAILQPGLPEGTKIPIDLRFYVNEYLQTGYRHVLHLAPISETVAQVLDRMVGTLRSVAVGFDSEVAGGLEENVRTILWRVKGIKSSPGCWGLIKKIILPKPGNWQTELGKLSSYFSALAQSIEANTKIDPEFRVINKYLFELAGRLNTSTDSIPPHVLIEQIRELVDRIQEPVCRLVRVHKES